MKNTEISRDVIVAIISKGQVTSLTGISKELGFKGSVSGNLSPKIKSLVPEVLKLLKANQVIQELESNSKQAEKSKSAVEKPVKVIKRPAKAEKNVKQSEGNCYRINSKYSDIYETLYEMGRNQPVNRKALIERICKLGKLDEKHANFNLSVILSPTKDGTFHRSARNAKYYVEKLADGMVQLFVKKPNAE